MKTHLLASRREHTAIAVGSAMSVAALLALVSAPSPLPAGRTATCIALMVVGVLACSNVVVIAWYERGGELSDRLRLDATGVIAIVALWLAGPVFALVASATPDLLIRWTGEDRLKGLPRLANFASYAVATVAAAVLLSVLGHPVPAATESISTIPALALAGALWFSVNYLVTRGLVAMLAGGQPVFRTIRREFIPALPSVAVMVACAAATGLATALIGPAGLAGLALAVLAPQLTVAMLKVSTPEADTLGIDAGRARYAAALSAELQLSRRQRRIVMATVRGETGVSRLTGELGDIWYAVGAARFYERERFDGRGDLRLSGVLIPLESRVVAVADAWAKLTAKGTLSMTQASAVASLERHQPRFDPHVVAAARALIGGAGGAEKLGSRIPPASRAARRLTALAASL